MLTPPTVFHRLQEHTAGELPSRARQKAYSSPGRSVGWHYSDPPEEVPHSKKVFKINAGLDWYRCCLGRPPEGTAKPLRQPRDFALGSGIKEWKS